MNNIINYIYMSCENNNVDLIKLTKNELLVKCEALGFNKIKSKNKTELIQIINNHNNHKHDSCEIVDLPKSNIDTKYNFIEVCSGGGGLSSGLIKSGFTPIIIRMLTLFVILWTKLITQNT